MEEKKELKKDFNQFFKPFKNMDSGTQAYAKRLCQEAAFMNQTLKELKENIAENKAIMTYINGNGFDVIGENPALKSYNVTIKNFNATIKLLADLLPANAAESDILMNFIKDKETKK